MLKPKSIKVTCEDGVELAALLIEPENPKAVVQINGGTAFKKEFYLNFARYLSEHGFVTIVYDYRGCCESAPPDLAKCDYSFLDVGIKDMPAVLDFLDAQYPHLDKLIFGHSVGGQQIGFMRNHMKIKALVCFAVSVGYIKKLRVPYRYKAYFFFKIFTPLSIFFTGYVKAKPFGFMENLNARLVREWAAWCDVPEYFFNEKYYGKSVPKGHFQDLTFPIHVYWASDDLLSNSDTIPLLWKHIKSTQSIDFQELTPQNYGAKSIDHHGFFRKDFKETLWKNALEKLNSFVTTPINVGSISEN
jgi:predicted alpha/beta hydrolase